MMTELAKVFLKIVVGTALILAIHYGGWIKGREVGRTEVQAEERQKAIEAGVGKWICDSRTGETVFVYGSEK